MVAATNAQADPKDLGLAAYYRRPTTSKPPLSVRVRVSSLRRISPGVVSIELKSADDQDLPQFTAGAHIGLLLPNDVERQYSLINDQDERCRYMIAVARDAHSRGGSSYVHEQLSLDDTLVVTTVRNTFQLFEGDHHSVFLAGGIGITPFISMAKRLNRLGRTWELHYCARSRRVAAFLPELLCLAGKHARLHTHFDEEHDGRLMDIDGIVARTSPSSHLYCCGPANMLSSFQQACTRRPPDHVHVECFNPQQAAADYGGFEVRLERQGRSVSVPPGTTILDALLAAGFRPAFACREGVCGTCEVRVLEGKPDHRDSVLSAAERESDKTMMICCSGSRSRILVLDL